ncbi:MAG: lectin like domain-containing protein [Clostridiales bacterium]|nr:lectin like domain-containing protein [Clostridiales bacterium]
MNYSKRFIALGGVVAITFLIKYNTFFSGYEQISNFRGGDLEEETWNPLIASSVNDNLLSVVIDNKQYTNEEYSFFMDDNLNIMVPVNILREALNCSAHVYDGKTLLVEKHSSEVEFEMEEYTATVNGEEEAIISPFMQKDDQYYVSLNDLSEYLDYSYSWDMQENQALASDNSVNTAIVPPKYDLREKGRVAEVRDQGSYGTCWSFAALGAMESVLLPEEQSQYSVDHMTLSNDFELTQHDGGDYTMGMAYLAAWKGPVYEDDDPYGDNRTDSDLAPVKHVQEMQIIDGKDYEKIKEAVFKYGGVQTSIYNALRSSQSYSPYFDKVTNSYCYIGTEKPNHDVVIIGWDDNYPKENFPVDLEGDGAFICQNSWGKNFGEDGVFYISYYDTNIGTHNVVYTGIEDTDNYDNIYQSDLCGWRGQLGYNKESMYGANVYTAKGAESLVAAGFYATAKDSQYELYAVRQFENESSFGEMIPVASGKLSNAGYYTVKFNQEIAVEPGEKYAIVLHIITPNSVHPMAIEYVADEETANVILDDGESYISSNGNKWVSIDTVEKANLCIKAFSNNQ